MPASILEWAAAKAHTPIATVLLKGAVYQNVIAVDVDFGYDSQSSSATVRIAADAPPVFVPKDSCDIRLGYAGAGGGYQQVFYGEIEDIDLRYIPYFIELKASGFLKRLQRSAGNTDNLSNPNTVPVITWSNVTDSQIWNDVMKLGNIPSYYSGAGDSRTITGPINLNPGDSLRDVIDRLDQASESGQITFEFSGAVYRRAALKVPSDNPNWRYAEGPTSFPTLQLFSIDRQSSDRDVQNQAIIQATPVVGTTPAAAVYAVRQAPSAYWGNDGFGNPIYVPHTLSSVFLETRAECDAVAQRYMTELNKLTDVLHMRTPLNPFAMPTLTVGVFSPRLDLNASTNYLVKHVHHHWAQDGASTDWILEGGAGNNGYLVGLPPVALFTMKVTKETYQVAGVPTTFYTVACDASTSFDPDGTITAYAWSNNKNGDTGTAVTYATKFTSAEWNSATAPTITLVVTDSDSPPLTGTLTQDVPASQAGIDVKVIAMYVAAYGVAEATPDGWETVGTWTPTGGAHAISVSRIAAEGTNYFGLDNGHIYKTTDYLATTPTDVGWTAPGGSAINALWMNEVDSSIIGIGLANGDFYVTKDAFGTAPTLIHSFVNPIQWVEGSFAVKTQWRVVVGEDVWFTNDEANWRVLADTFPGITGKQTELTNFANYASADGAAGNQIVKRESDGFPIAFPGLSPAPATARLTAFILTDDLLCGDDQGRSFISSPASAGTTFVRKTDIGFGAVYDLLRDNTNFMAAYAGCLDALAKTFDKAASWVKVRTYNGTTTKALRLGYDSAPLTPPTPVVGGNFLLERASAYMIGEAGVYGPDQNGTVLAINTWADAKSPAPDGSRNDEDGLSGDINGNLPPNFEQTTYPAVDWTGRYAKHVWAAPIYALANGATQFFDDANVIWPVDLNVPHDSHYGVAIPNGGGQGAAFIHRFKLPNIALGSVLLEVASNCGSALYDPSSGTHGGFYVNGTKVTAVTDFGGGHNHFWLDPTLFTADGITDNVVALGLSRAAIPTGLQANVGWKLTFTPNADATFYLEHTDAPVLMVVSTDEWYSWDATGGNPPSWWGDGPQGGETDHHFYPSDTNSRIIAGTFDVALFRKLKLGGATDNLNYKIADAIAPNARAATSDHTYFRNVFKAPGTVTDVTITVKIPSDATLQEVRLNTHTLGMSGTATTYPHIIVYHLTPTEVAFITASALNGIGFHIKPTGSTTGGFISVCIDFDNYTGTTT